MPERKVLDARFLINIQEYILSTMALSASEHGALSLLTGNAMLNGGWLPDDEKGLAKLARCTPREWRKVRPYVAEFFEIEGGRWTHKQGYIKGLRILYTDDGRLPQSEWLALRREIFERDNFTCTYCGAQGRPLECDHVLPVSRGGTNDRSNLTTACAPCNRSKKDKTVEEWRAA